MIFKNNQWIKIQNKNSVSSQKIQLMGKI